MTRFCGRESGYARSWRAFVEAPCDEGMSRPRMSRSRLAKLSHAQLVELAAEACEGSRELKNKADALIDQVAPLPMWCVDILMSPDLLPQLFSSLGLSDHVAASVCSTWSRAYSRQLRRRRYIDPRRVRRLADVPKQPGGLCMLTGGVLAITAITAVWPIQGQPAVNFVAARADSDPQALAAYRASSLAARRFKRLLGLARTDDGLLACNLDDPSAALYKFALDASMDELATAPALAKYRGGFSHCAVHQQTQRTYALAKGRRSIKRNALVLLDSNLRVIATVDAVDNAYQGISGVTVHGDQVIVLTGDGHPKGAGLQLLDLDGQFLRTIATRRSCARAWFDRPQAVTASHGRVFVVDQDQVDLTDFDFGSDDGGSDDDDDMKVVHKKCLHVIDIQSGDLLQTVSFELEDEVSAIIVDGDEIYIAGSSSSAGQVVVLQLAGSEA